MLALQMLLFVVIVLAIAGADWVVRWEQKRKGQRK